MQIDDNLVAPAAPARLEPLSGKKVLVVEDETLVAFLVEDMLADLGAAEVRLASSVAGALDAVSSFAADVAVLDVNLNGQAVDPVAAALDRQGVRFVFATGYGRSGAPEGFPDRPVVQKPFDQETLSRALDEALKG